MSKDEICRSKISKPNYDFSLNLPSFILVDGKLNWFCLKGNCPKHCCGPNFDGWKHEGISLFRVEGYPVPLTLKDQKLIDKNLGREYIQIIDNRSYLRLRPDGSCYFWNQVDGTCAIYDIRPTGCRAFPLFLDKYWGLYFATSLCPGFGAGWTDADELLVMLKALISLTKYQLTEAKKYFDHLSSILKG